MCSMIYKSQLNYYYNGGFGGGGVGIIDFACVAHIRITQE